MKNRISEVWHFATKDLQGHPYFIFRVEYISGLIRWYESDIDDNGCFVGVPKSVIYFIDHHNGKEVFSSGRRYSVYR